jgi:hypothetical protein
MDEVSKILTPKKKDQSANTKPPTQKFSPYPSEKSQILKDADRLNHQKQLWGHPLEKFIHGGGGGGGGH